jgi:hypothetical protein
MVMCCSCALAQSGAGSIQGTVTDATGAVIPGATIHVVQQGTNATFDTKSSSIGFYQVPSLFTGTYVVTITAPGFESYKTSIELLVAQTAVINPALTTGAVTQQVEVSANVVQLTTTDNGTIASTLENDRINQLPMNGRELLTLAGETTPGLENGGTQANGLMGQAMEYVADGVSLTGREFGGEHESNSQLPDPDSVQEVRIETTNTSAQYATPATGIITTKSGTNRLHGALFETARNNGLGLAKDRQDAPNFSAPHLVRNEYGASAGGPIILPHVYHGKDKSFWFFAYEQYSLASVTTNLVNVPTLAMKGGDFSGLINAKGVLQQLYDPATTQSAAKNYARTAFLNNQIPITRESPTNKILMDITPAPTNANNPLVQANYNAPVPDNSQIPTFTFRLDHVFNESNRGYLRSTITKKSEYALRNDPVGTAETIAADGIPAVASGGISTPDDMFAGAIGFTHVFSPTFFSETVLSQQWFGERNLAMGTPNADFESKLGLPNNFGESGFPYFKSIIQPLAGTQFQYGMTQILTNLDENLTKTIGKHQMQFGGRYRYERFGVEPDSIKDAIQFDGYATALYSPASKANYKPTTNTGYADGDAFLGAAQQYAVNLQPPYGHIHDMEFDAYFQDDWHVSRNLTVNLGLRYEAHPSPLVGQGTMESFDLKNDAMVLASSPANLIAEGLTTQAIISNIMYDGGKIETPAQAGMPSTLIRNNDFTIGPRVGLAYQPFGGKYGTVIRGAYGRYIYPTPVRSSLGHNWQNSPFTAGYSQNYVSAAQSPDGLPSYLLRMPQTVVMGVNSSNVVNSTSTTAILPGISLINVNPDYPPAYVTQTNFTIEQPLKGNTALRLTWLWNHGTNLDQVYNYNNTPSAYVWEMVTGTIPPTGGASTIGTNQYSTTATNPYDKITWGGGSYQEQKSGWSNDNALQVNYQRLYHRGIAYQISYVWSKPMRTGGNWTRDGEIFPTQNYANSGLGIMSPDYGSTTAPILPPARPAGIASYATYRSLDRFENYLVDTAIPKQHITFNGVVDLPFGHGKRILGNANRLLNELVGGFQLAGDGSIISQDFQPDPSHWGSTSPLHVYKHGAPITDCRSGVCYKGFEWFNGYIAPTANANSGCTTNCVSGLPSNWAPYQTPIDNNPTSTYYGSDEVDITLPGQSSPSAIAYQPGPTPSSSGWAGYNPYSKTVLNGPINYTVDLSVFKVFPITEKTVLRFNVDAFNALNVQGFNNPGATDGVDDVTSSYNNPRVLQLTLRLQF